MPDKAGFILDAAPILAEAVTLRQAVVDGDLREARFRTRMIVMQATITGLPAVTLAARGVGKLLRRPKTLTMDELDVSMAKLAQAIDKADPSG